MPDFSGQPPQFSQLYNNDTSNPDWAPSLDMTGCRTSQLIVVGVVFQ